MKNTGHSDEMRLRYEVLTLRMLLNTCHPALLWHVALLAKRQSLTRVSMMYEKRKTINNNSCSSKHHFLLKLVDLSGWIRSDFCHSNIQSIRQGDRNEYRSSGIITHFIIRLQRQTYSGHLSIYSIERTQPMYFNSSLFTPFPFV